MSVCYSCHFGQLHSCSICWYLNAFQAINIIITEISLISLVEKVNVKALWILHSFQIGPHFFSFKTKNIITLTASDNVYAYCRDLSMVWNFLKGKGIFVWCSMCNLSLCHVSSVRGKEQLSSVLGIQPRVCHCGNLPRLLWGKTSDTSW